MFTRDIAKGFNSAYDTVDLGDITNADVAISEDKVFVVWQDDNSGTIKYRIGSYSPITFIWEVRQTNFTINPNPASTVINLLLDNDIQNADISIVNLLGEIVLFRTIRDNSTTEIDVSGLDAGIYFVTIKSDNKFITQKFIKE
jgi:hypothetical protein